MSSAAVGSGTGSYIPAPPDELTAKLFRSPDAPTANGIGLYKLDFYSPQHIKVFPKVLRMDDPSGFVFCERMPSPPGHGG